MPTLSLCGARSASPDRLAGGPAPAGQPQAWYPPGLQAPSRRRWCQAMLALGAPAVVGPLAGCGGGGGGSAGPTVPGDTKPPTLAGSTPADGALEVDRTQALTLSFDEVVTAEAGAFVLTGPGGVVATETTLRTESGVTVAQVQPQRPLGFGQSYTLSVGQGVRDAGGNRLAARSVGFTTRARRRTLELGGIVMDSFVRRRFSSDPSAFNALPALVDQGLEWLRAAVTTVSRPALRGSADWAALGFTTESWSCLEVTGALMREGADLGMRLNAVLFLSDQAAHWGQQRRPAAWQGLDEAALAVAVEAHGRETALYYQSLGLNIEVWEIGNEIDAGAFGWLLWDTVPVPDGTNPFDGPDWIRNHLWVRVAPLLQAAIRGVRSVYPDAAIALHVAGFGYSPGERAPGDFFDTMAALGVPFDIAALSFPYMMFDQGLPQPFFAAPAFTAALDRVASHGKPIHIVEFGYNAKSEGTAVANPPYPYTGQGQADFVRDLALAIEGRVQRLIAFYPDWYDGMDPSAPELEGLGLFSAPGVPRPALAVFNAIAEGRVLRADAGPA